MSTSVVTLTASTSTEILAADANRDFFIVQLHTNEPTYLAFGEDASAKGILLRSADASVKVRGAKARLACNGYSAATPTLGAETFEEVDFVSAGTLLQ